MKKWIGTTLALALSALSFGQASLYLAGRAIADQGISLRPWGSGSIAESDEVALEGTKSIRISTRNFFQGGRMMYANPVDWESAFGDQNNLLLIQFQVAGSAPAGGNTNQAGGRGGDDDQTPPVAGSGGGSRQGAGGMGLGGNTLSGGNQGGAGGTAAATGPTIRNLRLVITTTDDKKSEIYLPISTGSSAGQRGWRTVGVPLQAIRGLSATNKKVKEVAISADSVGTFFIGEMKILNDSTPIYGQANHTDLNLALGDEIEFIGRGSGGASVLRYSWDFDSNDGIQTDAEGQSVRRRFRKAGTYTVTLTISDVYGLKKPHTTTIKVVVNP